jgi:hypothetical protein
VRGAKLMFEATASSGKTVEGDRLPFTLPTRIITCAWGEKYVGELLSITLPALLAPGNLPYVASVAPCELVILTEEASFFKVLLNPTVRKIQELCGVRLIGMDDLIPSRDQYGMAITYALHRGFSDLGASAADTWLLFLNSDFILADGSMRNVVRHLARGERLVAAPSYCVKAETAAPELLKRIDLRSRALVVPSREMAALVFRHRHDSIRGKTVNQAVINIRYMDQFYWLVNPSTLLGHQMPVAIVGMRPERNLQEPNSYWDYGLIREFCPNSEHFVLGDSDEFLMMELRRDHVTEEWVGQGRPEPAEIAQNMMVFATPYTKDMARHPLTLHSGELPDDIENSRAKLKAFVESVFEHLPRELPSHLGHFQFENTWCFFMEARHRYLSKQVGSATETAEPPACLSELDRVWWRLDGLTKTYSRNRDELTTLSSRQRDVITAAQARLLDLLSAHRTEADERLSRALTAMQRHDIIDPAKLNIDPAKLNRIVHIQPGESALTSFGAPSVVKEHAWTQPFTQDANEWTRFASEVAEKREFLTNALNFIENYYKERLLMLELELERAREHLQFDYERLLRRPTRSGAKPHTITPHGPPKAATGGKGLRRILRQVYGRCYGRLPRVRLLHPYWSAMRHLIRIVDDAAKNGAANVLVVTESGGLADTIADDLPGVHAQVSLLELTGDKTWDPQIKFDLCLCTLGASELTRFNDLVIAAAPYMHSGGKIIGCYFNFVLRPFLKHEIVMLQNVNDLPWPTKIHYAGSSRSARLVKRFHSVISVDTSRGRLANLLRMATTLLAITPGALLTNLLESSGSGEHSSRLPKDCTSVTIEVTF